MKRSPAKVGWEKKKLYIEATLSLLSFPILIQKAYQLIESSDPKNACWSTSGSTFIIKDVDAFPKEEIPRFFKHNNLSSFVRQLNCYGFHKVKTTTDSSSDNAWQEYHHPHFQRGRTDILKLVQKTDKVDFASKAELEDLRSEVVDLKDLIHQMGEQMKQMHIMCQTAISVAVQSRDGDTATTQASSPSTAKNANYGDNENNNYKRKALRDRLGSEDTLNSAFLPSDNQHQRLLSFDLGSCNFHPVDVDDDDDELNNRSFASMALHSRHNTETSFASLMSMSSFLQENDVGNLLLSVNAPPGSTRMSFTAGDDLGGANNGDDADDDLEDLLGDDGEGDHNETGQLDSTTVSNLTSGVNVLEPIPETKAR